MNKHVIFGENVTITNLNKVTVDLLEIKSQIKSQIEEEGEEKIMTFRHWNKETEEDLKATEEIFFDFNGTYDFSKFVYTKKFILREGYPIRKVKLPSHVEYLEMKEQIDIENVSEIKLRM